MKALDLINEITATYQRHGWDLGRVLLRPATRAEIDQPARELLKGARVVDAEFDALWFTRPSHQNREAWELRLLAEQPYALFEAFEADEAEEQREEKLREMENRMREQAAQG